MTAATIAYIFQLWCWGMLAGLLVSGPIGLTWHLWFRSNPLASSETRLKTASTLFFILAAVPAGALGLLHLRFKAMGSMVARTPPLPTEDVYEAMLPSWQLVCLGLWCAGMIFMTLRIYVQWLMLRTSRLAHDHSDTCRDARAALAHHGLTTRVVIARDNVQGPHVIGVWHPTLVLPNDFDRFPADERLALIEHEIAHVRRRDFAKNICLRQILALAWFLPPLWPLYREICDARENACDREAVARGARPVALAKGLVRIAARQSDLAMAAAGAGGVKGRVAELLQPAQASSTTGRLRMAMAIGAVCSASVTGLLPLGPLKDGQLLENYLASAAGPVIAVQARDAAGPFELRVQAGTVTSATVAGMTMPKGLIRQQDRQVMLRPEAGKEPLMLTVSPNGRITWTSRKPSQ